jgi:hypothetical protein
MKERNVKNVFDLDGECVVIVSGIDKSNDVLAINMSDDEYDMVDDVLDEDMTNMVELGMKMMHKCTDKNIDPKDVYNYIFNSILWHV